MNQLSVSFRRQGQELSANLTGSLVSLAALKLNTSLHDKADPWDRLIIDLTQVTDVDTTGLNTLFQTNMRCIHKNVVMRLRCQADHPIKALMKLLRVENEIDMELV